MLNIMILEGLKFIIPILLDGTDMASADDDIQDAPLEVPWVFRDSRHHHMLQYVLLPMGGTKPYLPKAKAKAKGKAKPTLKGIAADADKAAGTEAAEAAAGAAGDDEDKAGADGAAGTEPHAQPEPAEEAEESDDAADPLEAVEPAKKKARGRTKGKSKAKAAKPEMDESKITAKLAQEESLSVQVADGSREKFFLDDVDAALMSPLERLTPEQIHWNRIAQSVSAAYKYLWCKDFDTPGVEGWKAVREQLQISIIKTHLHLLRPIAEKSEQLSAEDADEAARDILKTLHVEQALKDGTVAKVSDRLAELSSDRDLIMGIVAFQQATDATTHPRYHPSFRAIFDQLFEDEEEVCK